ncbi:MAG: prenyltransferase [Rhodocyclaceae bacterium]
MTPARGNRPTRATAEPTPERFTNPWLRYLAATRPAFLSVTLIGCLLGIASARASGVAIEPLSAILTVVLALLAHAGGNVINDYHDAVSGADDANTGRLFPFTGGSRFIQNGVLSTAQTARYGYLLLALAVPGGFWLAWTSGPGLLAIGALGLLLAWAYSAPPLKLVSRSLGEFVITTCWLLVVVGADFVQRGSFAWMPVAAGLSFALLVANLLYINQFPDHAGDAAAGKRTVVVALGTERAKWGYFGIALVAHLWLIMQVGRGNLPQSAAAAAITLVIALNAGRMLRDHADEPGELGPAIKLTIVTALAHGAVLAATLGLWVR